jgi:hypothetical protein
MELVSVCVVLEERRKKCQRDSRSINSQIFQLNQQLMV